MTIATHPFSKPGHLLALLLLSASLVVGSEMPARAGLTFTVDSTTDAVDANPGDGTCASAAGECTLRAAVMEANANPLPTTEQFPEHTIRMPGGVFGLTIDGRSEDEGATGDLDVHVPVEILGVGANGPQPNATAISGGSRDRVFHFHDYGLQLAFSRLRGMRIDNAKPAPGEDGGIILAEGDADLVIERVRLGPTEPMDGDGGAIANHGFLQIENAQIGGNIACNGGGIYSSSVPGSSEASLLIDKSLIIQNEASDYTQGPQTCAGGGIWSDNFTSISATTISGNSASDPGGGLWVGASGAVLDFVTLADNSTPVAPNGGGIFSEAVANPSGENNLRLQYTLLARNNPTNCGGAAPHEFHPNFEDGASCGFTLAGSVSNTDAMLSGFPADTGGFSPTYTFASGSPAIDGAPEGPNCAGAVDQRGAYRPFDGDNDGEELCDFGAFEKVGSIRRTVSLSLSGGLKASGQVNDASQHIIAAACGQKVPVQIQRKTPSGWDTVKSTTTTFKRTYETRLADKPGKYRALAPETKMPGLPIYTCLRAVSAVKTNT